MNPLPSPPKWADRFFKWYCNPDLQEEILGDLYERFEQRVEERGLRRARLWYWINIFLFVNKYTLRRKKSPYSPLNPIDMLRNYFKVGLRNMFKHKLTTFINVFGMALAIGGCLVIFNFLDGLFNLDRFHQLRDEIYVVEHWADHDGQRKLKGVAPEPLGQRLQTDFPQIKMMTRLNDAGAVVQKKENVFKEWISFVDPSFFELLDFPVKYGDVRDFEKPFSVVLTEETAVKYFGSKNPVGESLQFRFNTGDSEKEMELNVLAVLEKLPARSSLTFNILLPFDQQKILGVSDFQDWSRSSNITFLHIPNRSDIELIKTREPEYLSLWNQAEEGYKAEALHFQPLRSISYRKTQPDNSRFNGAHIAAIVLLALIAGILFVLVCFNYMNIALASVSARLKEISVRKVMGGRRWSIIYQFLFENGMICFLALLLGVLLAESIFQPWFNDLLGAEFTFNYSENWRLLAITAAFLFLTVLGGAGYPAFYISSFHPVAILKDTFRFRSKNRFRKILLSGQFLLTFVAICAAVAFMGEGKMLEKRSWGYDQKSLLVLKLEYGEDFGQLKEELLANPNVLSVVGSVQQMGDEIKVADYQVEGKGYNFRTIGVGFNYLETLDVPLINGRTFDENRMADRQQAIIVNETFTKYMGWDDPLGKAVKQEGQTYQIIGETRDFHYSPFYEKVEPLVIRVAQDADFMYLTARTRSDQLTVTAKESEAIWKKIYPQTPYDFFFLDAAFDHYFRSLNQVTNILGATAILTVLISIIGLFGLALLIISQKMKEMSIRKVLGASLAQLSYRLNKEFIAAILLAALLGGSLAYLLISALFGVISYDSSLGFLPFALALLLLLIMTLISISLPLYRLATSNPSRYLREE